MCKTHRPQGSEVTVRLRKTVIKGIFHSWWWGHYLPFIFIPSSIFLSKPKAHRTQLIFTALPLPFFFSFLPSSLCVEDWEQQLLFNAWLLSRGWVSRWRTSLNVCSRETTVEQTMLKSNPSSPCGEEGSRSLSLSEAAGGEGEVPWGASQPLHGGRAARHRRGQEVPSDIAPKAFQSRWKGLQLECLHWALFSVRFRMNVSRVSLERQLVF